MTFGSFQKINGHRIDDGKVPGSLAVLRRFEFGYTETRVRQPGHVANIVGLQISKGGKYFIVNGGTAAQRRIDDELQRGDSFGNPVDFVPVNRHGVGFVLRAGKAGGEEESQRDDRQAQPKTWAQGNLRVFRWTQASRLWPKQRQSAANIPL